MPQDRNAAAKRFALAAKENPSGFAEAYLSRFGHVLSTRLARELCPEYSKCDELGQAIIITAAKTIKNETFKLILKSATSRPIVVIAGGGPGSGKLTTIQSSPKKLQEESTAIIDASDESIFAAAELIHTLQQKRIPTIFVYIERPLREAAASTILGALENNKTLTMEFAEEFARLHANILAQFLALSAKNKKKKSLFHPFVIFNGQKTKTCFSTNYQELKARAFSQPEALEIFLQVADEMKNASSPFYKIDRFLNPAQVKEPRPNANYPSFTFLIARQLSENLRNNLIAKRNRLREAQTKQPPASTIESPAMALIHQQRTQDKGLEERTDAWRDLTSEGREKTLDREHPQRITFKEKTTHPHDMEKELIR